MKWYRMYVNKASVNPPRAVVWSNSKRLFLAGRLMRHSRCATFLMVSGGIDVVKTTQIWGREVIFFRAELRFVYYTYNYLILFG